MAAGQREAQKKRRRSKGEVTAVKELSLSGIGEEEEWMKEVPTLSEVKLNLDLRSDTSDMGEVVEKKNFFEMSSCQSTENEAAEISRGSIKVEVKVNVIPGSNPEEERVAAEISQGPSDIKVKVNVIPGSNLGEERAVKKRKMYKEDKLLLVCEWAGCGEEQENPDVFAWHVAQHCNDAEVKIVFSLSLIASRGDFWWILLIQVQHNPPPLEDCFLCLWLDCGFKTPSSEEMVDNSISSIGIFTFTGEACQLPWVSHEDQGSWSSPSGKR